MKTIDAVIDQYFELITSENDGRFSSAEKKIYDIFLDGLDLDDRVSIEAKRYDLREKFGIIDSFLQSRGSQVVVDAGCGIGNQAILLSLLGVNKVIAVDILPERLEIAKKRKAFFEDHLKRKLGIDFMCDDIFKVIAKTGIHMIYCKDSVSHIHPLEEFIDLATNSLQEQGLLVVDEPNVFNPSIFYGTYKQYYKKTGKFHFWTRDVLNPSTGQLVTLAVERLIRPGRLKKMLWSRGLLCVHISRLGGWLIPKTTISKMIQSHSIEITKVINGIEHSISHIPFANIFFHSFLLIAQKTSGH